MSKSKRLGFVILGLVGLVSLGTGCTPPFSVDVSVRGPDGQQLPTTTNADGLMEVSVSLNQKITFLGTDNSGGALDINKLYWQLIAGDAVEVIGTGGTAEWTFENPGTYTVRLGGINWPYPWPAAQFDQIDLVVIIRPGDSPGGNPLPITGGELQVPADTPNPLVVGTSVAVAISQISGGTPPYTFAWLVNDERVNGNGEDGPQFVFVATVAGTFKISVLITDANGQQVRRDLTLIVIALSPPPPPVPTVNLKVNDQDGPLTLTLAEGASSIKVLVAWGSSDATGLTASSDDDFTGPLALEGNRDVWLTAGTHTLRVEAVGAGGTASDEVQVTVNSSTPPPPPPPPPPLMEIISITLSAPHDGVVYRVGETTTFTVTTTRDGSVGVLLQTMSWPGVLQTTNRVATMNYIWPRPVDPTPPVQPEDGACWFWPEDRDNDPYLKFVSVRVLNLGQNP